MGFKNDNVLQCEKSMKTKLFIGFLMLFVMAGTVAVCAVDAKRKIADEKSLEDWYYYFHDDESVYNPRQVAYIDVKEEIFSFAGTDDNSELYDAAFDENGYVYVLKLNGKQEKEINDSVAATGSAHIRGVTSEFRNTDARQFLLEDLQEAYPDEGITAENMDDISGYLQLNVKDITLLGVMAESEGWYALVLIAAFIAALFLIPFNIIRLNKVKKLSPEMISLLDAEMESGASWMPTLKTYATENFVVGVGSGIVPCRYEDILMLYKQIQRYNGIKTNETVKVLKRDGSVVDIVDIAVNSLQRIKEGDINSELEYLGNRLTEKNPNVFLGYNAQVFMDLRKRAKNGEFAQVNNFDESNLSGMS